MKEFIDKTAEANGTPINRNTLMAMQGFVSKSIIRNADGSITETNAFGETLTTTKNADGSVTQIFVGEKTITKNTRITDDNTILEEVLI